jgi:hypothetical protein
MIACLLGNSRYLVAQRVNSMCQCVGKLKRLEIDNVGELFCIQLFAFADPSFG